MRKVLGLSVAFLRESPVRAGLTTMATAAATCLVIWVASSYDALEQTFDDYAHLAMGRYELAVAPISRNQEHHVPEDVLRDLAADPAVAIADPMWAVRAEVKRDSEDSSPPTTSQPSESTASEGPLSEFELGPGAGPNARLPGHVFLATDASEPPFEMLQGVWLQQDTPEAQQAVVRTETAQRLGVAIEDTLRVEHDGRETRLRVVGILDAPELLGAGESALPILAPSTGEIFVTREVARTIFGESPRISLIAVALQTDADITAFRFSWAPRLSRYSTPVQFQQAYEIEEALDQSAAAANVRLQAFAATGVAMLVALLVVFCTLSMGVNERVRQYAILRAISFTRLQIAQIVTLEGLLLGGAGFVGGVTLSWLILRIVEQNAAMLEHGTTLGTYSLLLALLASLGGAFFASLVPAWRATRVRPIDAMAPTVQWTDEKPVSVSLLVAGLLLIGVNPLVTFVIPPPFEEGIPIIMAIGFTGLVAGLLLISPAVVAAVDRWGSPLVARLLQVDRKLLASQLTSNLWRSVGAAISLAVGMGLFISIQVWGFTMLEGFIPGAWAPDALLMFKPEGLPPEHAAAVARLPGIDPERSLPIVVEQPRLLHDLTESAERASVTRQDNLVLVGIHPSRAFAGRAPLLAPEWVAGSPEEAVQKMEQGRACIVPDHFLRETGLSIGDTVALVPPEAPEAPVHYEIAGAVRLPGWHWQTKLTGFRTRTHRAAALVFANYDRVAEDFDFQAASHVWFDYASNEADPESIAAEAQNLYASLLGTEVALGASPDGGPAVRILPAQRIREFTRGAARRWIWVISQVPILATVIASFGVLNVILASVRARRWELGVLRSLGVTRSALVRAILAEGLLIGIAACLLSLIFGLLAGWCGCGIAQYISFFGGLNPDLVVPWKAILAGMLWLLVLATFSAIWPAISIGRTKPLKLLQEGA